MRISSVRVLYDHQIFEEQGFGGISRYFTELIANLPLRDLEVALIRSDNQHLLSLPEMRTRIPSSKSEIQEWLWGWDFRGKRRLFEYMRRIAGKPSDDDLNRQHALDRIRNADFDVFHPTYYDPYFIDALGSRPFVLTVHDMIHELFPGNFAQDDPTSRRKRELCHRASRIIAVSESTKNDLITCFDIDPERIDVVYHGVSVSPEVRADSIAAHLPQNFLLFVGKRAGYKNFSFFVSSIADFLRQDRRLRLICTGEPFSVEERALLRRLAIAGNVMHVPASDSQLALLYRRAAVFVFPSLYEGFGMPILEAFACRCPVVLCNTAAMREVAGDAALFFEPGSSSDLVSVVSRVLIDEALKKDLTERGSRRATQFSWRKAAADTAAVYLHALSGTADG